GEVTPSASPLSGPIPRNEDNSKRTPNLWTYNLEGRGRQLTTFCGGAVRWPTVALKSGDIAFEYGADLWRLKKGAKEPEKIALLVAADEKQTTRRRERLTSGATEAEPSPDGKLFAFALRGDLWTIPIEKPKGVAGRNADLARRLTDWAGDDSDFVWSQDGKKLYFTSDRDGNTRLYEMEVESLAVTPLWQREEDVSGPHLSPDGKQLGFWVAGPIGGLYVRNLESGDTRRVIKLPGPQWKGVGGGDYAWSPDMKWIAYEHRGESRAVNIWIVPAEGGEPINLTRLYANHGEPVWSPDGKYLVFHSNRDGEGIYLLPLTHEAVRVIDTDFKYEKPKGKVEVKFDWDDITRRIRKISSQSPQGNLVIAPDGQILFLSGGDVWSASFDGKDTKRLTTGGGKLQLRLAADGKTAYFMQGGDLYTMNVGSKSTEKVNFTADWQRDVRAERKAAFAEFWRSYHRGFYDG
ncbi:MAG: PD40 domain-containing protein, partial [Fimbriimonas ginsengisoli]|nr:PD40 domain-containing protein [Fimbriimonas ginsengisoli]